MRIISQNGRYDLPYNKCIIQIDGREITASLVGKPDSYCQMVFYSTKEEVEDAMDDLHAAFILHEAYKMADTKLKSAILTGLNDKKNIMSCRGIVQFS